MSVAYGGKNLAVSNDYRNFFSEDNPELLAFEHLQDTFDKSDNVMLLVTPKDGKVFTNETLASIQWLTEEAWQTPFSSRVDSITNFQHTTAEEDDLIVRDLVEESNLSDEALLKARDVAVSLSLIHI